MKPHPSRLRSALAAVAVASLAACASAPPPAPAAQPVPERFAEAGAADAGAATPAPDWWTLFRDPVLAGLEHRVAVSNQTLAAATARLRRARAEVDVQASAGRLQVDGAIGTQRAHTSANVVGKSLAGRTVDDHAAALAASWEPDLFGRVSGQVAAARADARASQADVDALRLALQADVARTYLALRAVEAERASLLGALDDDQSLMRAADDRLASGTASAQDVEEARAVVEDTRAQADQLAARHALLLHALATLTGVAASDLHLPDEIATAPLPAIAAGVPADLLRRRPDVAAAAERVDAANARAGVARLAWFPSLSISLAAGVESTSLAQLLTLPSRAWTLGPSLLAPLLDGGRRDAQRLQADADLEATAADYRATVLKALNDVEDQLSTLHELEREETHRARALQAAAHATEISQARYEAGTVAYAEVLAARLARAGAQRVLIDARQRRAAATVNLVAALGGGWRPAS